MRKLTLPIIVLLILQLHGLQVLAQKNEASDFQENFNIAKQHLSFRRVEKALPYLLYLNKEYPKNANLKYLIGLCYAELEIVNPRSIELLEEAKSKVSLDYNPNTLTEEGSPIYTHYYLTLAYVQNGNCSKAKQSFETFQSIYPYNDEYYLKEGRKQIASCNETERPKIESLPTFPNFKPYQSDVIADKVPIRAHDSEKVANEEINTPTPNADSTASAKNTNELGPIYQWVDMTPTKVVSRTVQYSTKTPLYGVQLGAFKEVIPVNRYRDVKNVDAFMDKEGLIRYVVGHFSYKSQARSLLDAIKDKGYKDAFVVNVNIEKKFSETVISIDDFNINASIHEEVEFKVQLGAFQDEIPEDLAEIYFKIEGISEHKDELLTYITVGNFKAYKEAKAYQEGIKATGIDDAFVIAVHRGKKVPLQSAIER